MQNSSPRPKYINYSKEFTCVPAEFFDKDNRLSYMRFLFGDGKTRVAPTGVVMHQRLATQNIVVIHAVSKEEYDTVKQLYPGCEFTHIMVQLIDAYSNSLSTPAGKRMVVNPTMQGIDIVCFERNELLLANHFDNTKIEEMVYFTLLIWNHLGFNQEADTLCITDINNAELTRKLQEYIRHIVVG
ncbi:hypothetical protein SAMD00024442_14_17 [Candidatus Symbiothrix dinenymphae]|nr:hypothetical protein SAMD00024442_14_17 [Candidatus Symbiothrix dinenymphae]